MENTKDLLQIKIDSAMEKLPKESQEAINSVNWKSIIVGMNTKYSYSQLEDLEIETELLLANLILPEEYEKELEKKMHLEKNEIATLLQEMDKNVFKKIQMELEKILDKEEIIPLPPYAIKKSDETKIEDEEVTPKAPETEEGIYENSGIEMMPEETLPNTEAKEEEEKKEEARSIEIPLSDISQNETVTVKSPDISTETPATILEDVEIPNTSIEAFREKENVMLEDSGIDVVEETPLKSEENVVPETETEKVMMDSVEHPENIAENILMSKLKGGSVSNTVVSDHSLPKINADKSVNSSSV